MILPRRDARTSAQADVQTNQQVSTHSGTPTNSRTDARANLPVGTQSDTPTNSRTDTRADLPVGTQSDIPTNSRTDTRADLSVGTQSGSRTGTRKDAQEDARIKKRIIVVTSFLLVLVALLVTNQFVRLATVLDSLALEANTMSAEFDANVKIQDAYSVVCQQQSKANNATEMAYNVHTDAQSISRTVASAQADLDALQDVAFKESIDAELQTAVGFANQAIATAQSAVHKANTAQYEVRIANGALQRAVIALGFLGEAVDEVSTANSAVNKTCTFFGAQSKVRNVYIYSAKVQVYLQNISKESKTIYSQYDAVVSYAKEVQNLVQTSTNLMSKAQQAVVTAMSEMDSTRVAINDTPEAVSLIDAEEGADTSIDADVETDTSTDTGTETDSSTDAETDTDSGTETDTGTDTETEDSIPYSLVLTRKGGECWFNGHRETWYSQRVLPGGGLDIPGRHVDDSGLIRDIDGYICVASDDYPKGTIIETSLGTGKVYDCGCPPGTIDIYTDW